MTSYFIYYRVAPQRIRQLLTTVNKMQATLRAATGINGRLMRRDDATDTWMEIYQGIADSATFEAALSRTVSEAKFEGLLADGSERHIERFVDA